MQVKRKIGSVLMLTKKKNNKKKQWSSGYSRHRFTSRLSSVEVTSSNCAQVGFLQTFWFLPTNKQNVWLICDSELFLDVSVCLCDGPVACPVCPISHTETTGDPLLHDQRMRNR